MEQRLIFIAATLVLAMPAWECAMAGGCLRNGCHAGVLAPEGGATRDQVATTHRPVAEGRCEPCHKPHRPATPPRRGNLLLGLYPAASYVGYSRAAYSACLGACHPPGLVETPQGSDATAFRNGDVNLHFAHVVKPARGRSCRLCHVPHTAANPALVRRGIPFGAEVLTLKYSRTPNGGRCETTCHMALAYDREEPVFSPMRVPESGPESKTKQEQVQ